VGKISDIKIFKNKIKIGKIEGKLLWELDNQKNLKGNPLKAFETCLKRICSFEKYKIGRNSYYNIIQIYDEIKEREHKNKISLIGNKNRINKIGFEMGSNVEFVAGVLMNKAEYFYNCGDTGFKSISTWVKVCGLISENEFIQNRLRNLVETAIKKLHKLEFVEANIAFMKCENGEHIPITEVEFNEYREKSNFCFKKSVGEKISNRYKSYYQFQKLYKWYDKYLLQNKYWKLMNTEIEYVYKVYKLTPIFKIEHIECKQFNRLLDVVFGDCDEDLLDNTTINENITEFVRSLEEDRKNK